jgi:hypothetical protein
MLHPKNYHVNQTWMIFKVNEVPLTTAHDGDFNYFVLMDAASCYIVSAATVPVDRVELPLMEAKRMLKQGKAQKNELPQELIIPFELRAELLAFEAKRQGIKVVRLPEAELQLYTKEARQSFREKLGGPRMQ